MIYTELTKKAMRIAYDAHFGQTDRGGTPYICHPLHVADQMETEDLTVIALLHDVLEDTDVTAGTLSEEGIPKELIASVEKLTRDRNQTYTEYITELIESGDTKALRVKLGDLKHNMDASRCGSGDYPDYLRERYSAARTRIEEALRTGGYLFEQSE